MRTLLGSALLTACLVTTAGCAYSDGFQPDLAVHYHVTDTRGAAVEGVEVRAQVESRRSGMPLDWAGTPTNTHGQGSVRIQGGGFGGSSWSRTPPSYDSVTLRFYANAAAVREEREFATRRYPDDFPDPYSRIDLGGPRVLRLEITRP